MKTTGLTGSQYGYLDVLVFEKQNRKLGYCDLYSLNTTHDNKTKNINSLSVIVTTSSNHVSMET